MGNVEENKRKSRGVLDFLKSRGRAWLLVAGVVIGVLLLLFGTGYGEGTVETGEITESERVSALEDYCTDLEKQIGKLCDAVDGVGGVEVMVTLGSGYRTVYTIDSDGDPATVGSGSGQQALYETICPPTVTGVSVVCNGGDRADVRHTLTDLISTALGISSSRVCVAGK